MSATGIRHLNGPEPIFSCPGSNVKRVDASSHRGGPIAVTAMNPAVAPAADERIVGDTATTNIAPAIGAARTAGNHTCILDLWTVATIVALRFAAFYQISHGAAGKATATK